MELSEKHRKVFLTPLTKAEIWHFQDVERKRASTSRERYRILPEINAFSLNGNDILQLTASAGEINIESKADGLHIGRASDTSPVILDATLVNLVDSILSALKRPKLCAELEFDLADRWDAKIIRNVCESLLGLCVEAPSTIKTLETQLPLGGLLRFPVHSPYKLPRAYWENSIAVRQVLPLFYDTCESKGEFINAIAGLHRLATVGESANNFYGGAGGLPTEPGVYRQQDITTGIAPWCLKTLEWWLKFLNVPVRLVKKGIIKSIGKQSMVDISLEGRQCLHLYDAEGALVLKLLNEGRDNLRGALQSAKKGNADTMLGQLARFLQSFAIAHPFNNVNASIAMNVVNDILEKQGMGVLPHLYLDYIAQRTTPSDFSLVFKAVFEKHRMRRANIGVDHAEDTNMRRLLEVAMQCLAEQAAETEKFGRVASPR